MNGGPERGEPQEKKEREHARDSGYIPDQIARDARAQRQKSTKDTREGASDATGRPPTPASAEQPKSGRGSTTKHKREITASPTSGPTPPEGYGDIFEQTGISDTKTLRTEAPKPKTEAGQFGHKYYEKLDDLMEDFARDAEKYVDNVPQGPHVQKEFPIDHPDYDGLRVDRVDWKNAEIYEIKPNTEKWIAKGKVQAQQYAAWMNKYHKRPDGKLWKVGKNGGLITYDQANLVKFLTDKGYLPAAKAAGKTAYAEAKAVSKLRSGKAEGKLSSAEAAGKAASAEAKTVSKLGSGKAEGKLSSAEAAGKAASAEAKVMSKLGSVAKWGKVGPLDAATFYLDLHAPHFAALEKVSERVQITKNLANRVSEFETGARALGDAVEQQRTAELELPIYPLELGDRSSSVFVSPEELAYVEDYYAAAARIANDAMGARGALDKIIAGWDAVLDQANKTGDFTRASAFEAVTKLDLSFSKSGRGFRDSLVQARDTAARVENWARHKQYHAAHILGKGWVPGWYSPPTPDR